MSDYTIYMMPGERRQQRVRIYGCNPEAQVIVQTATWELHSDNGGGIVDQGSCVVSDDNLLTFMLAAPAEGWYHLLLTCAIGPEIYKTTAGVIVRDCHRRRAADP